ncbi:MAG TPA: esterase family protein [Candidatus Parabacteroides intestinavium]|nr:esterase family protein [Candidatus Parabacteroides intestinavium]
MRKLILCGALAWMVSWLFAAQVDTLSVRSESMRKGIKTIVIVPDVAKERACPTVYLLHGFGGNYKTWLQIKPELPRIADRMGFVFVCPDGAGSWYWDSPRNPDVRYETFISTELVRFVDARYNTIKERSGRAITGLSMGGHGAMWNAIRHSEVFGAAGSTSGGLDIRPFPKSWEMYKQLGARDEHPDVWDTHTVINLVPGLENGRLALIVDCGYGDFFFDVNQKFHEALLERGIDHDFLVRPGEHNNTYWRNSIDYQLLFFQKYFEGR